MANFIYVYCIASYIWASWSWFFGDHSDLDLDRVEAACGFLAAPLFAPMAVAEILTYLWELLAGVHTDD